MTYSPDDKGSFIGLFVPKDWDPKTSLLVNIAKLTTLQYEWPCPFLNHTNPKIINFFFLWIGIHMQKSRSSTLFDIANLFWYFGHVWPNQSKIILPVYGKLWCLPACNSKIIQTCVYFGRAWPNQSKKIVSTCSKRWYLSAQKSVSSFTYFFTYC